MSPYVISSDMTSTYVYDATGLRIMQSVRNGDDVTKTFYPSKYVEVRGKELIRYIHSGEQRIARQVVPFDSALLLANFHDNVAVQPDEAATQWYVFDHLGGTSLILDANAAIVSESVYYPYGLTRYHSGAASAHYQYVGKELDESGLYYFGARYYDPTISQFLSVDPRYAAVHGNDQNDSTSKLLTQPRLANLYAYSVMNPIRFIDSDGFEPRRPPKLYFEDLTKHYLTSTADAKRVIGGLVDRPKVHNTCAVRLSRSLNMGGLPIPNDEPNLNTWTVDGKHYARGARELARYLTRKVGLPSVQFDMSKNSVKEVQKALTGKQGIFLLKTDSFSTARGHATLFDGATCLDSCFWNSIDTGSESKDTVTFIELESRPPEPEVSSERGGVRDDGGRE
ncbi:hypothetical protein KFU94_56970 [Chloroflexi bacterium TSY]|nr:hypothetical protein [Chloroflexi bacterium TSY]